MTNRITPIVMPKWGLSMTEGLLSIWSVAEGAEIAAGEEICEIETTKLANMFESPVSGVLRRQVAAEGEEVPVGALIAVLADTSVSDDEIDNFIGAFQENFVPEVAGESAPEPETLEVDGYRMVYLKTGDSNGPPVLLLHGFGADMNGWLFNHSDIAEVATVYAVDLPGHGKSDKRVGDGSLAAMADKVEAFIDALSLSSVHLVGHSMGGATALHIASSKRVRVASLTLIDSAALGEEINVDFLCGFIEAKRHKHLRPILEQLVHDKSLISTEMLEDVIKFKRIDGVIDGLKTIVATNFDGGRQQRVLRDVLAPLAIPVTVIWGRNDEIIPVAHTANLPDHVRVEIIENSGHVPQMENASVVNELIKATVMA